MKRETLLAIAVILLLALNVATLAFVFFSRPNPPHAANVGHMLVDELNFSEEQKNAFEVLKHDHRSTINQLDGKYRSLLTDYLELLKVDSVNVQAKDSLETEMAAVESAKANVTLEHFKQVKAICTQEQKATFNKLIPQLIEVIAPPVKNTPPHPHP